jgi:[acyl-carrier-protein] S-malonyltransferase
MADRGLVFLYPGQGSQYVGMGKAFYDAFSEVRGLFGRASEILSLDMERICFQGPEADLVLTDNVQPAITLVNMACSLLLGLEGVRPGVAAGHSLGEYSALHAAGVLDEKAVLQLVRLRGQRMQDAADRHPGAMAALLNLPLEKVREICDAADIEVANINGPGQIIVSGTDAGVARAVEMAAAAGSRRSIRLNVSGPWHSRFMRPAQERFALDLARYTFKDPEIAVVANVNADYVRDGATARENLALQVCAPVRWQESVERLIRDGHRRYVEVGPKRVLRGLLRQIDREVEVWNVEDPKSLEECLKGIRGEQPS